MSDAHRLGGGDSRAQRGDSALQALSDLDADAPHGRQHRVTMVRTPRPVGQDGVGDPATAGGVPDARSGAAIATTGPLIQPGMAKAAALRALHRTEHTEALTVVSL